MSGWTSSFGEDNGFALHQREARATRTTSILRLMARLGALASLPLTIAVNAVVIFDDVMDITPIERFLLQSHHRGQVMVTTQSVYVLARSTLLSGFFMIVNVVHGHQMITGTGPWDQLCDYERYIKKTPPSSSVSS